MAGIVPNTGATYARQAVLDTVDLEAIQMGSNLTGVVSGCATTTAGGVMTVAVAAGVVRVAGRAATYSTATSSAMTSDPSNPKWYLITVSSAGSLNAPTAGTAAADPKLPSIPATSVVVAAVYLPAGTSAITSAMIVDKRVMIADQRDAIYVASANSPNWMKASAHYVCDGTADDVQWQAAIDYAETIVGASTVAAVHILPGDYHLAATVNWKTVDLIGAGGGNVAHNVRVFWSGAANGTVIAKVAGAVDTGGGGAGMMSGIAFRGKSGADYPGTWIDGTADQWDKFLRLREVQFGDCTGSALKVGQWYNCHLYDLRFDGFGRSGTGGAIEIGSGATTTPNLSSFLLEGFTVDWGILTGGAGPDCIFKIFNNDQNNMGPVVIRDGRIEGGSHSTTMSGNKSVVEIVHDPTGGGAYNSRTVGLRLENLSIFNESADNDHTVIGRTTSESPLVTSEHLSMVNVFLEPSKYTAFKGGSWPAGSASIPLKVYYPDDHYGHSSTLATSGAPTTNQMIVLDTLSIGSGLATITSGTGAPSASPVDGSIYLRTDGAAGTTLYVRAAGAWSALT